MPAAAVAVPMVRPLSGGVPAADWAQVEAAAQSNRVPLDDPRLLAYFAVGRKSPRMTKLKLAVVPGFGCLRGTHCAFEEILVKCEELCGRKDCEL